MKDTNKSTSAEAPGPHSPFWPVFAVFCTLILLQSFYLIEDFRERSRMNASKAEMSKALAQAQTVNLTAERVGHELLALAAAKSAEAAKIVAEFQIKTNALPQASTKTNAPPQAPKP